MKLGFKISAAAVIILLVISLSLNIVSAVNQTAVPGSDQDPIVSKSYVDAAIKELSLQVQLLLEQNEILKGQSAKLSTELTNQGKLIKTLQDEVSALKSGSAAAPGASSGSGTGGTQAAADPKPADQAPAAAKNKAVVNTAVLNLRSQPNTTSSIVAKLVKNETLTIVSQSNGWYKVTTSKGKTGYVLGTLIIVK